jgi:hypothetical protein
MLILLWNVWKLCLCLSLKIFHIIIEHLKGVIDSGAYYCQYCVISVFSMPWTDLGKPEWSPWNWKQWKEIILICIRKLFYLKVSLKPELDSFLAHKKMGRIGIHAAIAAYLVLDPVPCLAISFFRFCSKIEWRPSDSSFAVTCYSFFLPFYAV